MSYGTCESAGEKSIGLDQDKKQNWMREGQTNEPQSKTGVGQPLPTPHPHKRLRMNPILAGSQTGQFFFHTSLFIQSKPLPREKTRTQA